MRTDPKSIIVKEESSHHQDDLSAAATLPADSAQDVDPAAYSRCRANLTSSTFPQLHKWTQSYLPLLQSVVKADNGVFNAILLVAHLPDKSWGEKQWFCNSHRVGDLGVHVCKAVRPDSRLLLLADASVSKKNLKTTMGQL